MSSQFTPSRFILTLISSVGIVILGACAAPKEDTSAASETPTATQPAVVEPAVHRSTPDPVRTPDPTPAPAPAPAPAPVDTGLPTDAQWEALRQCEASGKYDISDPSGTYHGAYQFNQQTWDGVARSVGRDDLVGMRPSRAQPADQDTLAIALYRQRGSQPWGRCARFLN